MFRFTEQHLQADETISDKNVRHCICKTIASNGFMDMHDQDPSDMWTNYLDVDWVVSNLKEKHPNAWIRKIR